MAIRLLALAVVTVILTPALSLHEDGRPDGCEAAEKRYLSKDYIDSLVQSAMLVFNVEFNADMLMPDVMERKLREGIRYAKQVAARLRKESENDANRQYILWKLGELEEQIWLEEKGLFSRQENRRQKAVNDLVDQFNAETGKYRPDFVTLNGIVSKMATLDQRKSQELGALVSQRNRNISREVVYSIEKAIQNHDMVTARSELDYCRINGDALLVPWPKVQALDSVVQVRIGVEDERKVIEQDLKNLHKLIDQKRLGNAWRVVTSVNGKIENIEHGDEPREAIKYRIRLDTVCMKIGAKEDSLVQVALAMLRSAGVDSAMHYMEFTLFKYGVQPRKIGIVDMAILQAVRLRNGEEYHRISTEFKGLPDTIQEANVALDRMVMAAKQRAQEKADSARAAELARYYPDRSKLEKGTPSRRPRTSAQSRGRPPADDRKQRAALEKARKDSLKAAEKEQQDLEKALQSMTEIYTMLEQKKTKAAYDRFMRMREPLKKHISPQVFETLQTAVLDARAEQDSRRQ